MIGDVVPKTPALRREVAELVAQILRLEVIERSAKAGAGQDRDDHETIPAPEVRSQ